MKKNLFTIIFLISGLIITTSCSDSSTDSDIGDILDDTDVGTATVSVSGDFTAGHEGSAIFAVVNIGNAFSGQLIIADDTTEDTFTLTFSTTSTESISMPAGEYTIRQPDDGVGDGSVFFATYVNLGNNPPKSFAATENVAGTLKIDRSTSNLLEGSFEFTAEGGENEEVTISGQFTALK